MELETKGAVALSSKKVKDRVARKAVTHKDDLKS